MLELKVVELEGLQKKEDVIDWAKIPGNNKDRLVELVKNTPEWIPSKGETASLPLVNQPETNKAKVFNCTDLGNAKRLVAQHGDKIRYPFAWKKWLVWDGKTWSIDNNGQILRLAKDTVKRIYEEAGLFSDESQRKAVAKWAVSSESEHRINAMISLAESEPGVPISPNELDTNPYLLNCRNGTIDLRTGKLLQHDPKDFITKIIPVEYHPEATCPKWIEFLETIFDWNYDLIPFTQRAVGYSLTGDTSEQCLFLLHGLGANGKSTFIDVVSMLLGDYSQGADFETFLIHKNETIRNDLARMTGRRFISAIESEGERRLAEVLIKQLTGGDTITARFLFGEYFDFKPTFKIWLAANHKPNIKGTDYAIWRRIKLIPFNITIPEDKRIPKSKLMEMFSKELPGILTWAVQGCLEWQKSGLQTPEEVKSATNNYREEMDSIGAFLGECCILTPEVRSKASDLYGVYKKWCETGGEYTLSQRGFGLRLTERGLERVKSSGNYWKAIGLKTEK
jgi:putative DNA primase/helicase